ncbi:hypothetical protein WJX81_002520 [Elliptochloris bilobata]|uniref:Uncharacterized protein n=1 Tax=Elliptochloris bilobata TaxID=381761 RepID=A0AAW1SJV8_9CHLO
MVLVLAIHSVSAVTAKVPFSMIALIDYVRQKDLPSELKCRQVFPTSGGRSSSLWDVASIPLLLEWLDEHMDESTTNEVFEVQEAFAYGVSAELTRLRTAEKVSANTRATAAAVQERTKSAAAVAQQQMSDLDAKYRVSEQASAVMRVTSQAASRTATALGNSMRFVSAKAMENERVSAAASSVNKLLSLRVKATSSSEDGSSAYSANPSATAAAHGADGAGRSSGAFPGASAAAPAQPAAKMPAIGAQSPAPAAAVPASGAGSPAPMPASSAKIFTLGEEDEHPK